jgi:hypothetical protein
MTERTKHPGGRPTKYRPEFCQVVIECGERGESLHEMAEACDVHRSTIDYWAEHFPEFSEALARANQKSRAFFERVGRTSLDADKFNSRLWERIMMARWREDYTNRNETTHRGDVNVQIVRFADDDDGSSTE